jgi:hypothetical protein
MLVDPKWEIKFKAGQILNDAAQYLETHGWCQGAMKYKDSVCLFGAIDAVSNCFTKDDSAIAYEINYRLRKIIGVRPTPHWNDAPERTKQEVIDMLRKAAQCG